jgi:hypothetical protein
MNTTVPPPIGVPPYVWQQLPASTKPWEIGPIAGSPPPSKSFPAGSFIDGLGAVVTPTGVVRTIGGLGN